MIELRIGGNALTGRLPLGLTRLPLQEFDYADTELCAPVEAQFQAWLNAVESHEGNGMECAPATDRDLLVETLRRDRGAELDPEGELADRRTVGGMVRDQCRRRRARERAESSQERPHGRDPAGTGEPRLD